jgi:mannosyltransferase OCH1-like enzyme
LHAEQRGRGERKSRLPVIPRTLHFVWIGDENRRPDNCIDTWRKANPTWEVKIWGNAELLGRKWINHRHMSVMAEGELNGVADMMRYEILHSHGGFAIDADSICVRALEDWLLEPAVFSCWENEICRPGLLASGYLAAEPGNALLERVIADIKAEETVADRPAWQSTGPLRLTETWRQSRYPDLTVYPSHYFIPEHYGGVKYTGSGPVFATQLWAGTRRLYDDLSRNEIVIADSRKAKPSGAPSISDGSATAGTHGR